MFETYGVFALVGGLVLALIGYVWLLVAAWRVDWRWALAIFLMPLAIPIFVVAKFRRCWVPVLVLLIGAAVVTATIAANLILAHQIDLGPREKIVDGQLHITITGWDNPAEDYALLAEKTDLVVLQMANPDVTDQTLEYLAGLTQLEELDLNDTGITDAGLARLSALPRLRVLRIRGARVTDDGFRATLMKSTSLQELDARETEIASKTLRQWKSVQKEVRRYLK